MIGAMLADLVFWLLIVFPIGFMIAAIMVARSVKAPKNSKGDTP